MNERYDQFDRVYHMYDGKEGECALVYTGEQYGVLTSNDEMIEFEKRTPASIYAGLRALYGNIGLVDDRQLVPLEIAINGKAAITTYEYMAHYQYYNSTGHDYNAARKEIAEITGVSHKTVQKYLRRIAREANEIKIGGERDHLYWL
ncbi:hypothetical protein [Halorubrum sp. F4]|uniref:hypothetical protein n=1 Tax=Halorubrum sp. F4 TaxID=2989715 RepID=UPI0024809CF9|nr:hypothetical protein [Halorubrum sp. F4]